MTFAVLSPEQLEHLVERAVTKALSRQGAAAPDAMSTAQAAELAGEFRDEATERNLGKGTYIWTRRKETVLFRAGNRCEVCGYAGPLNVHHKIPRAKGGTDELDNLVALCPNHHAEAHAALRKNGKAD